LGVVTLMGTRAMSGFRGQLLDTILGLHGHVVIYSQTGGFEAYHEIVRKLPSIPRVRQAIPIVEGQIVVSSQTSVLSAMARGTDEDGIKALRPISGNVVVGTLDGFDQQDGIAIGQRLASSLGVALA